MENQETYRLRIWKYLSHNNIKAKTLAKQAGIDPASLHRFLKGTRGITLLTWIAIKNAMERD